MATDFTPGPSFERAVVLSGAGLSVAAGLSTFRGDEGLWTIDPDLESAMSVEAVPGNLPGLWRMWAGMFLSARAAGFTAGHRAIAEMGARVITQNVDGLHQLAGSTEVVELHGNGGRARCLNEQCPWRGEIPAGDVPGGERPQDFGLPPECPSCGSALRPDVILFGEQLPDGALEAAADLVGDADLFISVGTSGTVVPAATLAPLARDAGAVCVSIDPHAGGGISPFDHVVRVDAQQVLPHWAWTMHDHHGNVFLDPR